MNLLSIYLITVLALLCLINCQNVNNTKSNEFVKIKIDKVPKCNMFKICNLDVGIKNEISFDELIVNTSDSSVLLYKSIEVCSAKNCPAMISEFIYETDKTLLTNYTIYQVKYEAIMIGKANLQFSTKNKRQEILESYEIIVIKPARVIDIIFDIWIYTFGLLIALLMGVLLDKDSLLKIIKMPKAIIIGFCCQYITMPLVRISYLIFHSIFLLKILIRRASLARFFSSQIVQIDSY